MQTGSRESTSADVRSLCEFLDSSPTAFHAVASASRLLEDAGFKRLSEADKWKLSPGGGYYVIRHDASIVAFRIGAEAAAETGFRIATAHTDSPCLKIKPHSENRKQNSQRVAVEVYGGAILMSWFDRPLAIAGVVVTRDNDGRSRRLVDSKTPVAIIPSLAIHLNRDVNKGIEINPQENMCAVLTSSAIPEAGSGEVLARILSKDGGGAEDSVEAAELFLYDPRPAEVFGIDADMLSASRLDNQAMCHAITAALTATSQTPHSVIAGLFDSEEIGSTTFHGAGSNFMTEVAERVVLAQGGSAEDVYRSLARSVLVSGDAAHAVHPNFVDKHDESYRPVLNGGPVVKMNARMSYTTTAETAALFEHYCRQAGVPFQRVIGRSDLTSGGTLGPITSARLGIRSVDVGSPIWAMHSLRETGGVSDHGHMIKALSVFYASPDS